MMNLTQNKYYMCYEDGDESFVNLFSKINKIFYKKSDIKTNKYTPYFQIISRLMYESNIIIIFLTNKTKINIEMKNEISYVAFNNYHNTKNRKIIVFANNLKTDKQIVNKLYKNGYFNDKNGKNNIIAIFKFFNL